jgi:large subunit ribosomal protein L21
MAALNGQRSGRAGNPVRPAPDSETFREERNTVKHAIIETGGKQYRVAEGDVVFIEKLPAEAGDSVTFDRVLAVVDGDDAVFGSPLVEGATVAASVVKNGRSRKIRVFKMKPKKGYRRTQGHRQAYTKVQIGAISGPAKA